MNLFVGCILLEKMSTNAQLVNLSFDFNDGVVNEYSRQASNKTISVNNGAFASIFVPLLYIIYSSQT